MKQKNPHLKKEDLEKYVLIIESDDTKDLLKTNKSMTIRFNWGRDDIKIHHHFTTTQLCEAIEEYIENHFDMMPLSANHK